MPRARSLAGPLLRLLDRMANPVYALDDERRVLYCNAACAAWLGIAATELVGQSAGFHSSPNATGVDAILAGLCPPPEVFNGTKLRGLVSRGGSDLQVRRADFIPLEEESGGIGMVLTIVDAIDAQPEELDSAEQTGIALHEAIRRFHHSQASLYRLDRLVGVSPQIVRAREQAVLAARNHANVTVVGPAGSGKQHLARAIHYRGGDSQGPLVPLPCSSLSADPLVSTLVAISKEHPARPHDGTHVGTLLLLDIDQLPADAFHEFAQLLQRDRIGLRLVATAKRPLDALAAESAFPADLACALSTITIELPALANRLADLSLLCQLFVEEFNARGGKQISSVSPEALDQLAIYPWPGNLDELNAMLEESHARAATVITPRDLSERIRLTSEAGVRVKRAEEAVDLVGFLASVERELIERALARAKGNKTRAAKLLGMTRPRFYRRLVQLGFVKEE